MSTLDGEQCCELRFEGRFQMTRAADALAQAHIRTYEADLRFHDQFLMARHIHGALSVSGIYRPGRRVDRVFVNPQIGKADWQPELSILSLDIETGPTSREIYALALSFENPWSKERIEEVFFVNPEKRPLPPTVDGFTLKSCGSELELLEIFLDRLRVLDPDIITGWNVLEFDLRVIFSRCRQYDLAVQAGRTSEAAVFLTGDRRRSSSVIIAGRQVLDAVRLVRAAPERYEDYTLETVANAVLGRGKALSLNPGERKIDVLLRMRAEDPVALCRYCGQDARLVLQILETTGLLELTLRRCLLIGIGLDRAWTSIAAFDFIYIEGMHERGYVAPTLGVDSDPMDSAPGGAILTPQTGLFDNVFLFDFKSLYPSIMRTFNIGPLSFVPPKRHPFLSEDEKHGLLRAPNGALFRRTSAVLPDLLDRFFESREEAKRRGDGIASHVYKIIMNSFYGVLGTDSCRFGASDLAGAITSFGQHLLNWCKNLLEDAGNRVIYGDTDSLFVTVPFPQTASVEELVQRGTEVCRWINEKLACYVTGEFSVEPRLELEFEKIYRRFFLPPVRATALPAEGDEAGPVRGRAKGYAGLLDGGTIEIKGMEAVRRDWTELAHEFQIHMLELVFRDRPLSEIQAYIDDLIDDLRGGGLDDRLVYRKQLRKSVGDYTRTKPPHVRAAALLDPVDRGGVIHYLWTAEGPQPLGKVAAPIDYDHYVDKQLMPIARAFSGVLNTDIRRLFDAEKQQWLF
jgi:DNA polymerase-2